ncbi:MAG: hypothetical protein R6X02_12870 [Enhygromyxa sp.]
MSSLSPLRPPLAAAAVSLIGVALLSLSSCGKQIEPEPICARARILPIYPVMITPTGRVLAPGAEGWAVSQLEVDGTLTPIATLVTEEAFRTFAWLEHDPLSGRMWLLDRGYGDTPAWLYQFDAEGQLEWKVELSDYERPVQPGALHYHDGSIYVTLSMRGVWPRDPSDPNIIHDSLLIERRDLSGEVVWARADYQPPNTSHELSSAVLVDVSGSALSMVATPPLIDYGPSYPLTIDIETGEVLWSGSDGHDPLRMAVEDTRLYLARVRPTQYDPERLPEWVALAPASSSVSVHDSSTGAQANLSTTEWDRIVWRYPGDWGRQNMTFGWLGAQLVSLVVADGEHGITVHDKDGALLCAGTLDLDFATIGRGVGIEGRSQFVVEVSVARGGADDLENEHGLLLIEPLVDGP